MNQLPFEIQVMVAENLEDHQDLLNARFVNKAISDGPASVLFRELTHTVSTPGLLWLLKLASSRYARHPRNLTLKAAPRQPNGLPNFHPYFTGPSALQHYAAAVSRLRNMRDLTVVLDNDLIENRRLPGDRTQEVFWTVVNAIFTANTGPSAYITVHIKLADHMTLMNDAIWPAPGRLNYQQWVSRLVDFSIDTEHLCRCLRHQVCLADHFALPNNILHHFEIEVNPTSWTMLQKGMFVPPRHQYQLTGLVEVKLSGIICTSRDLLGFLGPSSAILQSLEIAIVALAGIEGWQVGMHLPGVRAAVIASRWKYVFDNLREDFQSLTYFSYCFLAISYREGTEWWPNGTEMYTPEDWVMGTFTSRELHPHRIAHAQEGDELALAKLLKVVKDRSGAGKELYSRQERSLMRLAELAPQGRRILPARAERRAARDRMGGMT